jgi:hypothetical protein
MTTTRMLQWTKLPVKWIFDGGLRSFRWSAGEGGQQIAALLVLAVLGHHAVDGHGKLTYDELGQKLGISRTMIAAGLSLLEDRGIIERGPQRSAYSLCDMGEGLPWAKLPAKGMYGSGVVAGFQHFKLRQSAELNALKLYFLFAAMRNPESNSAQISFDKIVAHSGVRRDAISAAVSLLAASGLVRVESIRSESARTSQGEAVNFHRYRLAHLDSYRHAGTAKQPDDSIPFSDA